jgi:hypothetical protein
MWKLDKKILSHYKFREKIVKALMVEGDNSNGSRKRTYYESQVSSITDKRSEHNFGVNEQLRIHLKPAAGVTWIPNPMESQDIPIIEIATSSQICF